MLKQASKVYGKIKYYTGVFFKLYWPLIWSDIKEVSVSIWNAIKTFAKCVKDCYVNKQCKDC